jgi:hypothetical protein
MVYSNGICQTCRKKGRNFYLKKFNLKHLGRENKQTFTQVSYTRPDAQNSGNIRCVYLVDTQEPTAVDVIALRLDVVYSKSLQKLNVP